VARAIGGRLGTEVGSRAWSTDAFAGIAAKAGVSEAGENKIG